MTGIEIYKRTAAYDEKSREIRLHPPQWKLLLAYDGQRSLSEVALSAEVPLAEALPLTQRFLDEGWIAEQPITLDQYLKRIGAKDSPGAAVPPPTVLHEPGKPSAVTAAPVATPASPAVSAPQASTPRPPAIQNPPPLPPSVRLGAPVAASTGSAPAPAPVAAPTGRAMKLSAVVDFVTSLVGNIAVGQLLVYRIFLRVPPELLLAEDIASVYLVGDTSLIKGEKLQRAIADAVNAVAKKALPDTVFAAA
jgi:hypothetical protein